MTIRLFQVDAFTDRLFSGNPAAVCPMDHWIDDALMQRIAMENNLSETAFVVPEGDDFRIRWFTPTLEVDLCGHATLASAYVIFNQLGYQGPVIRFHSKSGPLTVTLQDEGSLTLDFPADPPVRTEDIPADLFPGLRIEPREVWKGRFDYMVPVGSRAELEAIAPDFSLLAGVPSRGVLVTAPGEGPDFVSRCFFPQTGVDEDPVTGSAHCLLTSYWSGRLGKDRLLAAQLSARGGVLDCQLKGDRVFMTGKAVLFLKGEIFV